MGNLELCLKKLEEENWRELTNTIVYVRCSQKLELLKNAGFKVDPRNDGFLALCFIDHAKGLSFYVISAAHIRGADIFVSPENKSSEVIFTAETLKACPYLNQQYIAIDFSRYSDYVQTVKKDYEQGIDDVLYIRDITELDDFRKPFFPDDIEVLLLGKDFGQERIFVRSEHYCQDGQNGLQGTLLDQPIKAKGLNKGDLIDFMLVERGGKLSTVHVV